MIYKFKSKATGDLIMLGPHGDQVMSLLGRSPAPKGIIENADMPAAIDALQAAIGAEAQAAGESAAAAEAEDRDAAPRAVALRQRLWPMIEMLRRAHAAGEAIVWGV